MANFTVGKVQIDWLTLTTYDLSAQAIISQCIESQATSIVDTWSSMQYQGNKGDCVRGSWVMSVGEQRGRTHWYNQLHSGLSNDLFWSCENLRSLLVGSLVPDIRVGGGYVEIKPRVHTTRIDLQLTLPCPIKQDEIYDSFYELSKVFYEHELKKGIKARKIKPDGGPDGLCTIYVGSEKSARRYCIYIKKAIDGNLYIRFEARYLKDRYLASHVVDQIVKNGEITMSNILKEEIETLPDCWLKRLFADYLGDYEKLGVPHGQRVTDASGTLLWLYNSCLPAFKKLIARRDEIGRRASEWLDILVAYREEIENE